MGANKSIPIPLKITQLDTIFPESGTQLKVHNTTRVIIIRSSRFGIVKHEKGYIIIYHPNLKRKVGLIVHGCWLVIRSSGIYCSIGRCALRHAVVVRPNVRLTKEWEPPGEDPNEPGYDRAFITVDYSTSLPESKATDIFSPL